MRTLIACALALVACEKDPSSAPVANPAPASAAFTTPAAAPPASSASSAPMPGSYRDAHGCIGSAGYRWCARENACVRMWELAKQKGFANDPSAFAAYCR